MEPSLASVEPYRSRNRRDNPECWPTNGASNHRHFWFPPFRAEIPHHVLLLRHNCLGTFSPSRWSAHGSSGRPPRQASQVTCANPVPNTRPTKGRASLERPTPTIKMAGHIIRPCSERTMEKKVRPSTWIGDNRWVAPQISCYVMASKKQLCFMLALDAQTGHRRKGGASEFRAGRIDF